MFVFQPTEGLIVTLRGKEIIYWPKQQDSIAAFLEHPWIPFGEIIGPEVSIDEIPFFDPTTASLEILRPSLIRNVDTPQLVLPEPRPEPRPESRPNSIPAHIVRILLERAERDGAICPITGDLLKIATSIVTPCGHIFEKTALQRWLVTKNTCPECRQIQY